MHQLVKHLQANLEHYQTATQQLRQEQTLLQEKQRSEYEQKNHTTSEPSRLRNDGKILSPGPAGAAYLCA